MTVGTPMLQLIDDAVKVERERTLALLLCYESHLHAPQPDADCSLNQRSAMPRGHGELLRQLIVAVRG